LRHGSLSTELCNTLRQDKHVICIYPSTERKNEQAVNESPGQIDLNITKSANSNTNSV